MASLEDAASTDPLEDESMPRVVEARVANQQKKLATGKNDRQEDVQMASTGLQSAMSKKKRKNKFFPVQLTPIYGRVHLSVLILLGLPYSSRSPERGAAGRREKLSLGRRGVVVVEKRSCCRHQSHQAAKKATTNVQKAAAKTTMTVLVSTAARKRGKTRSVTATAMYLIETERFSDILVS